MANIFPQIAEEFHSSLGEYQIFNALKKLPDDWNIYYSVNWQKKEKNGIIKWGEADFLVFNPNYGIIVIEVKSGGIEFKNGRWIQTRLDSFESFNMKNPFAQADKSKFKIIEELDNNLPYYDKCFVDKAVWFPSITREDLNKIQLPMEYDKKLVLTKESMENPIEDLLKVYKFYKAADFTNLSKIGEEKVKEIIMPNFKLVPSASNIKDESEYIFYQLTNEQEKVLNFIGEQNSVAIQGSAGTGKTFIAVEQARRFSKNGKVLFLCFNKYLNEHLKLKCAINNVEYYTLYSFISKYSNQDLYNKEECIGTLKKINFSNLNYRYIIVDEAQDIENEILELLYKQCVINKIKIIIFYDKNQLIFQNKLPDIIKDFDSKLTLLKNCRNTLKITSSVNSIFDIPIETNELTAIGIMPTLNCCESKDKIIESIAKKIDEYLKKGFKYQDIVILTLKTEEKSILHNLKKIKNYGLTLVNNNSDIFFTTSKKFKGLESNIVIVVDFDLDSYDEKNLYVSLSRAKQRLELYTLTNEEKINNIAKKIDGNINSIAKIGRKFKMIITKI